MIDELGVDISDHGDEIDEEVIDAMAKAGTFWVPSLIYPKCLLELGWAEPGSGREAAQELLQQGEALFIACDVTDDDSVRQAVEQTAAKFGRLDAAFNAAGIDCEHGRMTAECTLENWQRVLLMDLTGTFHCMRHQIQLILKSSGGYNLTKHLIRQAGDHGQFYIRQGIKGGFHLQARYIGGTGFDHIALARDEGEIVRRHRFAVSSAIWFSAAFSTGIRIRGSSSPKVA